MRIGYARVSTNDQSHDLQHDALQAAGCDKIFSDTASGAKAARPALDEALAFARPGDVLTVWRLDRLGRSLRHLIDLTAALHEKGVELRSLNESIDTTTPTGRLIFHIFGALAEFERELTRERTLAGQAARRARGRLGGRHHRLTLDQARAVVALHESGAVPIREICKQFGGISRDTVWRSRARVQEQAAGRYPADRSMPAPVAPADGHTHPRRRGDSHDDARKTG